MLLSPSCAKVQGNVADNKPCQSLCQPRSQLLGKVHAAELIHGNCRPGSAAGILDPAKQDLELGNVPNHPQNPGRRHP